MVSGLIVLILGFLLAYIIIFSLERVSFIEFVLVLFKGVLPKKYLRGGKDNG